MTRKEWYHTIYLPSEHWQTTSKRKLENVNYICQNCGARATQVHHHHYRTLWQESMDDLWATCRHCHEAEHEPTTWHSLLAAIRAL